MRHFLVLLFSSITVVSVAQSWNFIGSDSGINNASEVDIEISDGGQLFIAFIDSGNSNKITVKKWQNQSWQLVGTSSLGASNSFGLQLIMNGENPIVSAKYSDIINSSTYELLECYSFNGTSWIESGVGTTFWTYHNKDYAITCNTAGEIFATYYNRQYQTFPEGLITVKLGAGAQVGGNGTLPNLLQSYVNTAAAVSTAGDNVFVAFEESELLSNNLSLSTVTSNAHNTAYAYTASDASKIVFEKGSNSSLLSLMHLTESYNAKTLYYKAYNPASATYGNLLQVANSVNLTDFDFATQATNTFVFYKDGSICYFKQISGDLTPSTTISTISSGTTLCPATATSLETETNNGVHVIAYIDNGKCYVRELNLPATINNHAIVRMCEGNSWNNNGSESIDLSDDNFSHSNISMTCTSENTSIIPQDAIITSFDGSNNYYLTINNTNDVSVNTMIDLKWELFEDGNLIQTFYMPATIYNTPTISFNFSSNQVCENASPIDLLNKAVPSGGSWSGNGVINSQFNPNEFEPSPTTSTYLVYSKSSQQGCMAKDSILFFVSEVPHLAFETTNADCNSANGTASVTISGGISNYSGHWSNGAASTSIYDLEPGHYYFYVADANGCTTTGVTSVGSNGIEVSKTITNVMCYGKSTGGIDLTVQGVNQPFTYAWSNGATSQDLENIMAGPYEVTIKDQNGCVSTFSYSVLQTDQIILNTISSTQPECGLNNGSASVSFTGGSQPYSYQWKNAEGNTIGTNETNISNLEAGYYFLTVTDDEGCLHREIVSVPNQDGPTIILDTIIPSDCSNNGSINLTDISGAMQYEWSNGASSLDLTDLATGTYILEAVDSNNCIAVFTANVPAIQPEIVNLCLVTVDTTTNTNLIVWEKPISATIDHFNVYRETSQVGFYQLAASIPYGEVSVYNDLIASPVSKFSRYKMSSVDECGVESALSSDHKTIHLIVSQGIGSNYNLIWDSYEGFNYSEFKIYRHTATDGWNLIATMPTNLFTYTDTPPTENELEYLIVIETPNTCQTATSQNIYTTQSNKVKPVANEHTQGLEELLDLQTQVYPIPCFEIVQINNSSVEEFEVGLIDQTGQLIQQFNVEPGIQSIDLKDLSTGVYTLKMTQKGISINKRIIIQQ